MWDDKIKSIVQQKHLGHKKHLQTETIDSEAEHKHRRATAKREIRNRHCIPGNNLHHT
jgi:hypothetical protein